MNWIEACRSGMKFRLPEWCNGEFYICKREKYFDVIYDQYGHKMDHVSVDFTLRDGFEFIYDQPRELYVVLGKGASMRTWDVICPDLKSAQNAAFDGSEIVHMREVRE